MKMSERFRLTHRLFPTDSIALIRKKMCQQLFAHLLSICVSVNYYSIPDYWGQFWVNAISLVGT